MICLPLTALILSVVAKTADTAAVVRLTQETPCMTGRSCRLQCTVSGANINGLSFSRESLAIVSCSGGRDSCVSVFPVMYSYTQVDYTTSYVDIFSFASSDAATWSCSDGNGTPSSLQVLENVLPAGSLTFGSTCMSGRVTSPASLSCSGLSPGTPPATLAIVDSNNQTVSSGQTGSVSGTVTGSGQVSCSVTWSVFPSFSNINPVFCDVQAATVPPTNAHGEERHDVECTERSMKISIPSYLLPQGNVTLLDPSCPLTLNGTDYVIDVGLSQCGTTIHFTDDHVVFVNTILTKTDTGAVDLTVPVGCQYPRLSNVSIAYMPLTHQARFFETNWGKLDVSMEQYKDDQFSTAMGVAGSVARMSAGQTVYLQIHIHDVSQADLGVMPRICVVSPSPSPLESNVDLIIRNGCPVHEHVQLLPSPGPAYFRFAFTADTFRFDSGLVYVHCETSLCELGPSCPAFCGSQGNVNATSLPSGATAKPTGNTTLSVPFGRRRRSAELPKESGTLLSAGPLLLVDEADAHAVPAGLVATIASIAAAAMVVVVALAVALHRARARNASVEKRLTAISVK